MSASPVYVGKASIALEKKKDSRWALYAIEAWGLGMFMISACAFTILLEHPAFPFKALIPVPIVRRWLMGVAMGSTAVAIIYSHWGKKSGAHINPSVTLTMYSMGKIGGADAAWYVLFQTLGGTLAVYLFKIFLPAYISHPYVNYVVTVPGAAGATVAFALEFLISFILMFTVLFVSNHRQLKDYTGYFAGFLVMCYVTFEAPFSGFSMSPARTLASAIPSGVWNDLLGYMIFPPLAMWSAGRVYQSTFWTKIEAQIEEATHLECIYEPHRHHNAHWQSSKKETA